MNSEELKKVDDVLKEMMKPLAIESQARMKQSLREKSHALGQRLRTVQDSIDVYLFNAKDSARYLKSQDTFNVRLQELQQTKLELHSNKTKKAEEAASVRAEEDDLKKLLKEAQQEGEDKVKVVEKRLEKERSTFAAYLALCGHVRLGTAVEPDGRLCGCVSSQPSEEATFRLDPAALSEVQLSDRLWALAAEGPAGEQRRKERDGKTPAGESGGKAGEEEATAAGEGEGDGSDGGEDKENKEANVVCD